MFTVRRPVFCSFLVSSMLFMLNVLSRVLLISLWTIHHPFLAVGLDALVVLLVRRPSTKSGPAALTLRRQRSGNIEVYFVFNSVRWKSTWCDKYRPAIWNDKSVGSQSRENPSIPSTPLPKSFRKNQDPGKMVVRDKPMT